MSRRRVIKKATRQGQFARIALDGPTGAGKTWTGLQFAHVLANGGAILGIDTEKGSMAKFAGEYDQQLDTSFSFDHMRWDPPYDPRELAQEIRRNCGEYRVILIDSASHFWFSEGGTLEIVDSAAKRSYGGNRFAGWAEGTPAQNQLIEAVTSAACHIVWTMRSKMEYVLDDDNKPRKVGMAPVQRDGVEYEFDVIGDLDLEHNVSITKSRCNGIADRVFPKGRSAEAIYVFGEWLASAEAMISPTQAERIRGLAASIEPKPRRGEAKQYVRDTWGDIDRLSESEAGQVEEWLNAQLAASEPHSQSEALPEDSPTDTAEDDTGAQNGSTAVSGDAARLREVLTAAFVSLRGGELKACKAALVSEECWPIASVPDELLSIAIGVVDEYHEEDLFAQAEPDDG